MRSSTSISRRARTTLLGLLAIVPALTACGVTADADVDRDLGAKMVAVRERMHVRFAATHGVRMAIAYGDLDRARGQARTIAALDEPDILPQWKPYIDNVRAEATALARAEDTVAASRQLALLGWRCAQCHETVPGAKTIFPSVAPPSARPGLASTMAGHQWATGRMWEGLIGPSVTRWNEGAAALAKAPLAITAEGEVPGHELGIANDVARIRMLATRAPKAKGTFERAELYGELLATCARCHHTIRDR